VIFVSHMDRDEYQVPTGSYLGDMTNELKDYGANSYITEFAVADQKIKDTKLIPPTTGDSTPASKSKDSHWTM